MAPTAGRKGNKLLRAVDVSTTRLGPRESWPHVLRTAFDMICNCREPLCIAWGTQWHLLYNAAWRAQLMAGSSLAFGQPARQVWGACWELWAPLYRAVMKRGERVRDRSLPQRDENAGRISVSVSPLRLEDDSIAGAMISAHGAPLRGKPAGSTLRLPEARVQEAGGDIREQRVLAEVGAALASLELDHGLAEVTRVLTARLVDVALLLVPDDAGMRRAALSVRDARWARLAGVLESYPAPGAEHPAWWLAAHSGRTELIELGSAVHAGAPLKGMFVPLHSGDACRGVLVLASARRAGPRDLRLAEEVGRRCTAYIRGFQLWASEREAVNARDEMLAIVAHDLRNPLSSILMQSAALRLNGRHDSRQAQRSVELIDRAARRMNRIIEDLADVAQLQAGQLTLQREPSSSAAIIGEAFDTYRERVAARCLDFRLAACEDISLDVDEARLQQVLDNLLGNALKFTARGSISIGVERRGTEVVFWVADTGAGIAARDLPHVFERFYQAAARERRGSGLGLSIVKGLVEAHGGRVWADSQLGQGSTFCFALPIGPRELHGPHV